MTSILIEKRQCPMCHALGRDTSEDNLAVYDDQHKYCYACGYYIPAEKTVESTRMKIHEPPLVERECAFLPSDISGQLGAAAKRWLLSFGLSVEEQKNYWWSDSKQQLIYAVKDIEGRIIFWQARNFDVRVSQKYETSGTLGDHLHLLGFDEPLILVEDTVSAIKLSREYTTMPLFGCVITKRLLTCIRDFGLSAGGKLMIWLDSDKSAQSLQYMNMAKELGIDAYSVWTPHDPKAYGWDFLYARVEEVLKGHNA